MLPISSDFLQISQGRIKGAAANELRGIAPQIMAPKASIHRPDGRHALKQFLQQRHIIVPVHHLATSSSPNARGHSSRRVTENNLRRRLTCKVIRYPYVRPPSPTGSRQTPDVEGGPPNYQQTPLLDLDLGASRFDLLLDLFSFCLGNA